MRKATILMCCVTTAVLLGGRSSSAMQKKELFKEGETRDLKVVLPGPGFLGSPSSMLVGYQLPPPTKPEDFVTRFIRITVLAKKPYEKGERADLRLDEIDKNGVVLKKDLYRVQVEMTPEGTLVSCRDRHFSDFSEGFKYELPCPLPCTTPVALLVKLGQCSGFIGHSAQAVEYSWKHPDPKTPAMTRVEAALVRYIGPSGTDIPIPLCWHGKRPKIAKLKEIWIRFRETQDWNDPNDWLWTRMERLDKDGNVLMRCEVVPGRSDSQ
jgi:hypothetical protein